MLSTSLTLHRRHGLPENCNNEIPPLFQLNWRLLPFGTFASLSAIVNCQFIMVDVIHEFRRVRTTLRKTFGVILETKHVNRRLSRYVLTSCRSCKEGIRTSGWGLFSYEIKRTQRQECTWDKTSDIYFIYLDNKDVLLHFRIQCTISVLFTTKCHWLHNFVSLGSSNMHVFHWGKGKGTVHPRTSHEGPEGK